MSEGKCHPPCLLSLTQNTICPQPMPLFEEPPLHSIQTPLLSDIPGPRSPLASAVSTALAGLGSCSGRGLGEGGDQGRGCSLCYSELLTGAAERGDSLL